jgi:hypothetical protein
MSATPVNLVIEKGTTFEASFYLTGDDGQMLNLNSSNCYGYIKKYPTSPTKHEFVVGINTSDGEINISMGSSQTSQLYSGRNYFDVFLNNTEFDFISRVVTGTIIVEETTL